MQKEHKAEKLFIKYKNKYIKVLGNKSTSNTQIDNLCRKEFPSKYQGSYAQDELFKIKNGYYIINNDTKTGPGIHWTAVIVCPKTCYIYDSFARDPKKLLKHFTKRLSKKKIKIISSDRTDAEQRGLSEICGALSIAWLSVAHSMGVRAAARI